MKGRDSDGLEDHDQIAAVLDAVRAHGLISDYLVSWRGRSCRLIPSVTVWSEAKASDDLRAELRQSLGGLVPKGRIVVVQDEPSAPSRRRQEGRTERSRPPLSKMQRRPSAIIADVRTYVSTPGRIACPSSKSLSIMSRTLRRSKRKSAPGSKTWKKYTIV